MKIEIKTTSYNQRRYGKPWIAVVDFSASASKPDYRWGEWVGDHRNGSSGLLIVEAGEGDIIAEGQKDFRKPANSAPTFYQVDAGGELTMLAGKVAALEAFRARAARPAEPTVPDVEIFDPCM